MFIQNILDNKIFFDKIFDKAILVGSSGDLLRQESQNFINSFDTIIRMNNSPTFNFEKNVGNKTTIRIINFKAIDNVLNENFIKEFNNTDYIILSINDDNQKYRFLKLIKLFPKLKIYYFNSKSIEFNDNLFKTYTNIDRKKSGTWLTTGWMSLFFMLNHVKEKHIIGLGGEYSESKYHYYSNSKLTQQKYYINNQLSSQGHRFITEKDIFLKWIEKYNLIFHRL